MASDQQEQENQGSGDHRSPLPTAWAVQSAEQRDGGPQGLDESGLCLCSCLSPGHLSGHTVPALVEQSQGRDPPRSAQRQTETLISAVLGAGLQSQQVLGFNPGFGIYQEALLGGLLSPQPHICKLGY